MDYIEVINRALAKVFGSADSRALEYGDPTDEEVTKVWRRKPALPTVNEELIASLRRGL